MRAEFDEYMEKMRPYENLESAEAEARQIEAERIIAEKQAAEEAARLAAEEAQGYETGITYDNIARTPDEYTGKKVKFTGKVIQLIEGSSTILVSKKFYSKK